MRVASLKIVILGLSITSSWGNGHAVTYRGLVRELSRRGHDLLFLERDVPWYAENRDLPSSPWCRTALYRSLGELRQCFAEEIAEADCVIVGSYVPEGVEVGRFVLEQAGGVTAFYDIDTPVTLAKLERGDHRYLHPSLISRYRLYLSFTGGPTLDVLENRYGSPMARPLYCSADTETYRPVVAPRLWDMGYLGTWSADRQPVLERLLCSPALRWQEGRFIVAGAQYPLGIDWPANVQRAEHIPPGDHPPFYCGQRYTLNVTRADMVRAGWSPSIRLFEAAACGVPVISDPWEGLETLFRPESEILIAATAEEVLTILRELPEHERLAIGRRARNRVLAEHTAVHRAAELESYILEAMGRLTSTDAAGEPSSVAGLTAAG